MMFLLDFCLVVEESDTFPIFFDFFGKQLGRRSEKLKASGELSEEMLVGTWEYI